MKTPICLFFLWLMLSSCSMDKEKKEEVFPKPLVLVNVDSLFQNYFSTITDKNELTHKDWVEKVYSSTNYTPIWIDNEFQVNSLGDSILNMLQHANYYGLESKDYESDKLQSLKKTLLHSKSHEDRLPDAFNLEVLLTDNLLHFAKHLNFGKIEKIDSLSILERKPLTIDIPVSFAQALNKKAVFDYLDSIQPKQKEYHKLRLALQKFVEKSSLTKEKVHVENYKEDSVKAYQQAKKSLVLHQYITKNDSESKVIEALKEFQLDHGLTPDGVVGKNTAGALSKSSYEYYQNAAISLERWRWKPRLGIELSSC